MRICITNGIQVTVEPEYKGVRCVGYLPEGRPIYQYVFGYEVTIENLSKYPVQLLQRHWFIFDSFGEHHEVHGDGVIGVQPIMQPGTLHTYASYCPLWSEIGSMRGSYTMLNLESRHSFEAEIPLFELIAPFKMN